MSGGIRDLCYRCVHKYHRERPATDDSGSVPLCGDCASELGGS